jgi:hypothetical protein
MRNPFHSTKAAATAVAALAVLAGCAAPTPPPRHAAPQVQPTPDLSHFDRFELVTAATSARQEGTLSFRPGAARFDVATAAQPAAGRLFVQPEACRDDPSADCQRRFIITGRMELGEGPVNCYVTVRNDTAMGYSGQSLSGICQDRHARVFSLTLFGR